MPHNALVENSAQGDKKPSDTDKKEDWKYKRRLPGEDETEQEPEAVSGGGHWGEVVVGSSYSHGSEEQN